tara:strand:+ start:2842 stop:3423 length:582 start_codon:yes stop_codon:yes gene_type:complete
MGNPANIARKAVSLSVLIWLAGGISAWACPAPQDIRVDKFERHFQQEKFLSGMDRPLRSEGQLLATDNQVIWHMQKPFDVKTMIGPEGITQSVDGAVGQPVGDGVSDISGVVADAMASMMRGNWNALDAMFSINFPEDGADGENWDVVLTPHDDRLKGLLGTISVHGCTDVSSVDIVRPSGDREHIQFAPSAP